MSVYIKSMEMPKPGQIVLVEIDENGDVFAAYDGGRTKLTQYKAVHVPDHGRLKDYDQIMKEYNEWFSKTESREYENMFYALYRAINDARTIVPSR